MEHPEILLIDKPKGITSFDVVYKVRRKLNPKPKKENVACDIEKLTMKSKRTNDFSTMQGATKSEEEGVLTSTVTETAPGVTQQSAKSWVRLKVGHAGTLDPLATGLMIIGVGKGTKKLTELTKLDKEYLAEVRIGEKRTTGDLEGELLEEKEVTTDVISLEEISSVVDSLVGTHRLPVSAYSAIKKDGVPMYKRARKAQEKGKQVTDVPVRDMTVYEAELVEVKGTVIDTHKRVVVTVRFAVASGVYVRSLGEELGKRLGYPATLQNLQRTKVGEFSVEDAQQLSDFT